MTGIHSDKSVATEALTALVSHRGFVNERGQLSTIQLHCSSRMHDDGEQCIVTVSAPRFQTVVSSMEVIFKAVHDVSPCASCAPPTKAERKERHVVNRHSKK